MGQIFLALHFIPSGISGPRLTALERAVDEILGFQSFEQQEPIDGEYMNIRSSGSSVGFLKLFLGVNLVERGVYLSILTSNFLVENCTEIINSLVYRQGNLLVLKKSVLASPSGKL